MKYFIKILFIYSLYMMSAQAEGLKYEDLKLNPMPKNLIKSLAIKLQSLNFKPVFAGLSGSKILKVNMMFSDAFLSSKIIVKYGTRGNYKLRELYRMPNGYLYHQKINNTEIAFYFENLKQTEIRLILKKIKSIKISKNRSFSIIDKAHADNHCFNSQIYPKVNIATAVAADANGGILSNCMSGIISGAEESTVGIVDSTIGFAKDLWSGIKSEYNKISSNPGKRLSEYWSFVSDGAEQLWQFTKTLGNLLINPTEGIKVLKEKFGEIGEFFVKAYAGVKAMPANQKAEILCNILGSIGVDVLITAITAGAGGAKLGITVTRILLKLKKITSILGKGLKVPFKFLEKLSDKALKGFKTISDQGNAKLLERRLKAVGCAI